MQLHANSINYHINNINYYVTIMLTALTTI